MIPALVTLGALTMATTAFGDSIEGRWNCTEKMNRNGLKGTISSTIDFKSNGTMSAVFNMDMRKVVVKIDATAKYNASYKVSDNKLIETPTSVSITKFDVAGIDMHDGDLAKDLQADLMRKNGTPPTVSISGSKMELRQPDRLISCSR